MINENTQTNEEKKSLLTPKIDVVFHSLFRVHKEKITGYFISSLLQEKVKVLNMDKDRNLIKRYPDALGNEIPVPGGFKVATDSGKTVEEGIIIEDNGGNQFVWIPISNIDGDNDESNGISSGVAVK